MKNGDLAFYVIAKHEAEAFRLIGEGLVKMMVKSAREGQHTSFELVSFKRTSQGLDPVSKYTAIFNVVEEKK